MNVSTTSVELETKKAWQDNWKEIDINTILSIFNYQRVQEMLAVYKKHLKRLKHHLQETDNICHKPFQLRNGRSEKMVFFRILHNIQQVA